MAPARKHVNASAQSGHYEASDLDTSHEVDISKTVRNRMSAAVNIAKAMFSKGVSSNGRTFNCTFAYHKSKLLAIGMNDYKKIMSGYIPKLNTHFKQFGESSYVPSLHGEMSCIIKLGHEDCSDIDFFSVRINKNGKCCNSKPCSNCARILHQVGFKHVYFFDEDMNVKSL